MLHRAARIQRLQLVLQIAALKNIIRVGHGELRRICIHRLVNAGLDNIGVACLVELGKAIARPLGGRRFEVINVAGLLLELHKERSQEIHDLQRERKAFGAADVFAEEVQAGFVHADQANRIEMVGPVFTSTFLDIAQIERRIRIKPLLGLLFNDLALDLQAGLAERRKVLEPCEEVLPILGKIADTRKIDGVNADRTRHRIAAEQTAAALSEFAGIEAQAAAHGYRVLGRKVGVDIVGKVRNAVLAGDAHEIVHNG